MMQASIITIGDELLIGQVMDTNSAWMAQELNKIGVWVKRRIAVGDSKEDIRDAIERESADTQIILITGGLGPTADDITKAVLAEYFGGKLIVDEKALLNVQHIFNTVLKRPIIERNLKQAEVPDVCKVLQNSRGTAPGMWFEKEGRIIVAMPGVPGEMKAMMVDSVLPDLQKKFIFPVIAHKTLLTAGIGESFLAERIQDFESALPASMKLAYLPNYGMVRLRITGKADIKEILDRELDLQFGKLKSLVAEWTVADEDLSLQEIIGRLLKEKKQTVATAESCTGGYIAHLITSIPGSSEYFKGSIVSYSDEIKKNLLNVDPATIQAHGAVSEETVTQMLKGALKSLKTDYALADSGIMGPGGGTPEKPVGTVWVAAGNKDKIITEKFYFRFDRGRNIELTSANALNMLRKFILSSPSP